MVQGRPERKAKRSQGRFDRARTVDPVRYAQGANRTLGVRRMANTEEYGDISHLPTWRQKLIRSQHNAFGFNHAWEQDLDGGRVYKRPPRGSKKTTVGKSKRKYQQRGSYSTRGRR